MEDYGMLLVKDEVMKSGQIGTPQYSAPEVKKAFSPYFNIHSSFSVLGYFESRSERKVRCIQVIIFLFFLKSVLYLLTFK